MTQATPGRVAAPTEERNPRTADIDRLPTMDVLRLINAEDAHVAPAVSEVLPVDPLPSRARWRTSKTAQRLGQPTPPKSLPAMSSA